MTTLLLSGGREKQHTNIFLYNVISSSRFYNVRITLLLLYNYVRVYIYKIQDRICIIYIYMETEKMIHICINMHTYTRQISRLISTSITIIFQSMNQDWKIIVYVKFRVILTHVTHNSRQTHTQSYNKHTIHQFWYIFANLQKVQIMS